MVRGGSGIYAIFVRLSSPACKGRKDRHHQNNSYKMVGNSCTLQIALLTVVETKSQRQCSQNHLLKLLLYEHTVLCPNTTEKSETKSRISGALNIESYHYHANFQFERERYIEIYRYHLWTKERRRRFESENY